MFYLCSANFENLVARMQRRALKENRLDDANIDVIRARLKTYEAETKPVLNFYGKEIVHRINTDGTRRPENSLATIADSGRGESKSHRKSNENRFHGHGGIVVRQPRKTRA